MHSILLATCRLDYGTNTSTLTSGGLGVAPGVHQRQGAMSQVGGQAEHAGGRPQPLGLSPALRVNRNILPLCTAAGGDFSLECNHEIPFLSLPSLLHMLSFSGWSCPVSHWLPISPQEVAPTCVTSG